VVYTRPDIPQPLHHLAILPYSVCVVMPYSRSRGTEGLHPVSLYFHLMLCLVITRPVLPSHLVLPHTFHLPHPTLLQVHKDQRNRFSLGYPGSTAGSWGKEGCRSGEAEGASSHLIHLIQVRFCIPESINNFSSYFRRAILGATTGVQEVRDQMEGCRPILIQMCWIRLYPRTTLLGLIPSFTDGRVSDSASRWLEM
jgi:hypothetical protein